MKVALIQLNAGPRKEKNIARAVSLVRQAIRRKAKLILLPEVFNYRGPVNKTVLAQGIAERVPGESTAPFFELARKHKIFILVGSIYEKVSGRRKVYNTSVLINDRGKRAVRYRKIHLFNAVIGRTVLKESKNFLAGTSVKTAAVGPFKLGLSICYDLRFPDLYQRYRRSGCQVLTIPSSFTHTTGTAHWEVLLRARAIENACFVLAPNQTGKDGKGVKTYGHSMIINPWGRILARASGQKEQVICADIRMKDVQRFRSVLPTP